MGKDNKSLLNKKATCREDGIVCNGNFPSDECFSPLCPNIEKKLINNMQSISCNGKGIALYRAYSYATAKKVGTHENGLLSHHIDGHHYNDSPLNTILIDRRYHSVLTNPCKGVYPKKYIKDPLNLYWETKTKKLIIDTKERINPYSRTRRLITPIEWQDE